MMKIYRGANGAIMIDGERYLKATPAAHRKSPTGMGWGYGGSGAYAAAHSLLADACGMDIADEYAMEFKWDVIAKLEFGAAFEMSQDDIAAWVDKRKSEGGKR